MRVWDWLPLFVMYAAPARRKRSLPSCVEIAQSNLPLSFQPDDIKDHVPDGHDLICAKFIIYLLTLLIQPAQTSIVVIFIKHDG